jgi:hypothetical protein
MSSSMRTGAFACTEYWRLTGALLSPGHIVMTSACKVIVRPYEDFCGRLLEQRAARDRIPAASMLAEDAWPQQKQNAPELPGANGRLRIEDRR